MRGRAFTSASCRIPRCRRDLARGLMPQAIETTSLLLNRKSAHKAPLCRGWAFVTLYTLYGRDHSIARLRNRLTI